MKPHDHFTGRTAEAVRLVVLEGKSQAVAAKEAGLNPSAVSRAVAKVTKVRRCPHCGSEVKEYVA